jgi:N6-adenosine-specific RNA methylase IME4
VNWPFGDLNPLSADVIAVDWPWDIALYSEVGNKKSASAQYDTMPLSEILEFAPLIGQLASKDCLGLMWGCEWMAPRDRQDVLEAMGFTYKSTLNWRKTTKNGKVRMGPGYRVRTMHEPIYLGTIGNPEHKAFPSIFDGLAREHSRKPESFYHLVEKHTPSAMLRLDIFSRQSRPNWVNWGREKNLFDVGQPASLMRNVSAPAPIVEPMPLFQI